VAQYLAARSPRVGTVGLLATTGTIRAGLYQDWLARVGIDLVLPDPAVQEGKVMPAIRAVKADQREGTASEDLAGAARELVARGAQVVIAGCTEIPLGLAPEAVSVPLVDPAVVLAQALVRRVRSVEPLVTTPP
jgi:aspartate racemase